MQSFLKRLVPAGLFLAALTVMAAAAMVQTYGIVVGTYNSEANAQEQVKRLEKLFEGREDIAALRRSNGFRYEAAPSGNYYVAQIAPIAGSEAMETLLAESRKTFEGAYIIKLGKRDVSAEAPVSTTPSGPVAAEPEPERLVEVETETEVELLPPADETPPAPVAPVAAAPVKPLPAVAPAAATSSPLPLTEEQMLYAAGGAALLLLLLLLFRRKKAVPATPAREAEAVTETPAAEEAGEATSEAAVEPVVEPEEEAFEEVTVEEEAAAEAELPIAEESLEVVAPAEAAAAAAEMPPAEAAGTLRKKRSYKHSGETITKEHFKQFSGCRLLVAEDNLINQKVIVSLLADSGIEVVIANDGQEALDTLARDRAFDMVLMDAHMPIMDGYEATEAIRANPDYEAIPVIALSGDTAADDIRNMEAAGMEGHLEKPLHLDALYEILYNYVDFEGAEEETAAEELLRDTSELHAEKGLDLSMGDEGLYREIIGEFAQMYGNSDESLKRFMENAAYEDAEALLLDVYGLAANIGADRLSEAAETLREAMLEGDSSRYDGLLAEYTAHLQAVLEDIKKV